MKNLTLFFCILLSTVAVAEEKPHRTPISASSLNGALIEVASAVTPAVAMVSVEGYQQLPDNPAGIPAFAMRRSGGSAVVISSDGYVVTNAHVVAGATRILVQLSSSSSPPGGSILRPPGRTLTAQLLGLDAETDIALLKVNAEGLRFLEPADSDTVRQGQLVVAVGSPNGLENSITMGVVSAVARQLQPDGRVVYIQTDAPINPGNSGGALVDIEGRLIGINSMMLSQSGGSEGLGFAVPSNIVRFVIDQLRQRGFVFRGEIGVEAQTITPTLAAAIGLSRDKGVVLADVLPGTPADAAGLKPGDIVLSLDGKPMENARQFNVNLYPRGDLSVVTLRVLRDGAIIEKKVVVIEHANGLERIAAKLNDNQHLVPLLSILAMPIDSSVTGLLPGLPRRPCGILVARLAVTTSGPKGDLQPGDVIYQVNREPVATLPELSAALEKQTPGMPVALLVERAGRLRFVEALLE